MKFFNTVAATLAALTIAQTAHANILAYGTYPNVGTVNAASGLNFVPVNGELFYVPVKVSTPRLVTITYSGYCYINTISRE